VARADRGEEGRRHDERGQADMAEWMVAVRMMPNWMRAEGAVDA
jgi:hypothetical protein